MWSPSTSNMDTLSLVFIVLCALCLLFAFGILLTLCVQVRRYPDVIDKTSMIIWSVLCIIFHIATLSIMIWLMVLRSNSPHSAIGDWLIEHPIAFFSAELCWHIAQSITYLLFILRTYYTFHNT